MYIDNTPIESILKKLLQQNIVITLNNKTLKKGKFILFKQVHYCIELSLKNQEDVIKKIELPIPFNVEEWSDDNLIYFDYRISTLTKNNPDTLNLIKKLVLDKTSKFYNQILEIEII